MSIITKHAALSSGILQRSRQQLLGMWSQSSDLSGSPATPTTSWAAVATFLCYSFFTAVLIGVFRAPLNSPGWRVIAFYLLIAALIFLAFEFGERLDRRNRAYGSSLSTLCFLAALSLPFMMSWLRFNSSVNLTILGVAIGLLIPRFFGGQAVSWRRYGLPIMGFSAAAAGYCFVTVNSMGYATVLAPENAVAGLLNLDTLYHSAIASMFREFGVPSTGLDGIPLTRYHTMSHIWLGTVAGGAHQGSVAGYYLGNQIVLIPVMYFSVAVATRAIAGEQLSSAANLASTVLPFAFLSIIGLSDWISYLLSESYALSLALILVGLPFLRSIGVVSMTRIPTATILVGCLIGFLACATKVSAGVVFLVGFGYLLIRNRKLTLLQYAFLVVIGSSSLWIMQSVFMPAAQVGQARVSPFTFIVAWPSMAIPNLIAIGVGVYICAVQWHRHKNRPWCEAVIVMLLVSAVPALILQLDGGSGFYFLNIGTWIAVAVIAAFIIEATSDRFSTILCATGLACSVLVMAADVRMRGSYSLFIASIERLRVSLAGDRGVPAVSLFSDDALGTIADAASRSVLGRIAVNITNHGKGSVPLIVVIVKTGRGYAFLV